VATHGNSSSRRMLNASPASICCGYPWSSAPVHCGTAPQDISLDTPLWEQSWTAGDWWNYLAAGTRQPRPFARAPIPAGRSAHRNLSKGWNATPAAPSLLRKAVACAKLPATHGNQLSISSGNVPSVPGFQRPVTGVAERPAHP
jgi:hypothetical protein